MLIFHTSDWHLGRSIYGHSLLEEQTFFIEQFFLPAVALHKPDLLLISGDIYDRQIAPAQAIALLNQLLEGCLTLGVKAALIAGNHDGADRLAMMKNVLRKSGIFFSTDIGDALNPVTLESEGEKAQLFLIPYLDPAVVRDYFQDDRLRGETACMRRVLDEVKQKFTPGYAKLLAAHCFVAGAETTDSESALFVGGSGLIPTNLFYGFDYVALGHLHKAQNMGKNTRYSGSPLKYSMDECDHKKSITMLRIEGGHITVDELPVVPRHDFQRKKGRFQDILAAGKRENSMDFIEVTLTDEKPTLHAAQQLRAVYPNLLGVRQNMLPDAVGAKPREKLREKGELEIFTAFLEDVCQLEVTDQHKDMFLSLLQTLALPKPEDSP